MCSSKASDRLEAQTFSKWTFGPKWINSQRSCCASLSQWPDWWVRPFYIENCTTSLCPGSPHPTCSPSGPRRSADLPPFQHEPVVVTVRFPWFSQAGLKDLVQHGSLVWTMSGSNSKEALWHQNHHRHKDKALRLLRICPEKKIWLSWHPWREPSGLHFLCSIQAGFTHTRTLVVLHFKESALWPILWVAH